MFSLFFNNTKNKNKLFVITDGDSPGCDKSGKKKKNRSTFSAWQIQQLEGMYRLQRYLAPDERTHVARSLRLSDRQVTNL